MTRKSFFAAASLGAWLSLAGCAPTRYVYVPATTTTTSADGAQRSGGSYPFPPDSPHGEIRLATFGLAKLSADAPDAAQLRMVVDNRSQETWVIDPREQKLLLDTGEGARRTTITANPRTGAGLGVVEVAAGQTATIDLAFALPPRAPRASDVPAFDAVWTVRVGARAITMTTTFERLVASGLVPDVPLTGYPNQGAPIGGERMPGTPDSRWRETMPLPERGLR